MIDEAEDSLFDDFESEAASSIIEEEEEIIATKSQSKKTSQDVISYNYDSPEPQLKKVSTNKLDSQIGKFENQSRNKSIVEGEKSLNSQIEPGMSVGSKATKESAKVVDKQMIPMRPFQAPPNIIDVTYDN